MQAVLMFNALPATLYSVVNCVIRVFPSLASVFNRLFINYAVNRIPHRPHPWSTVHDYTSWTALSDQHFSARHLPAFRPQNPLPAATAVMALFSRPVGQLPQFCPKSTCLFPAFAQYLTDGFIRTRMPNTSDGDPQFLRRQNTSNHQIDLCTLYGRTQDQIQVLRLSSNKIGERGRLKSQLINGEEYSPYLLDGEGCVKSEFETLDVPLGIDHAMDPASLFATGGDRVNSAPQVAMLNTLFLREHNRLASLLEQQCSAWDDERVFQTARNILIVMFIKIVVEEYINHINPTPIRFLADPTVAWKASWNRPNWITTEFSLLYRWHSLIPDEMTWGLHTYPAADLILNNKPLLEVGLRQAFLDMSAQPASRLSAFNTATALLPIEEKAINQARECDIAPFSRYRMYSKQPSVESFEDISSNSQTVALLKQLYGTADRVEFYPGLFADDSVPNSPLPRLILTMVAVDAFSQAFTNPLLSEPVFNQNTFSPLGWEAIHQTTSLRLMLERNSSGPALGHVSMTRHGWRPI
jgi:prostaglandin-endoperoxide synthase 2